MRSNGVVVVVVGFVFFLSVRRENHSTQSRKMNERNTTQGYK